MALQTTTEIFISGTAIQSYVSLKLEQEIDAHHDLELVCRTDVVEKLSEDLIGDSKEYLGGDIMIRISSPSDFGDYKELEFKGVITKVMSAKGFQHVSGDLITLYAKSSSIIADDGAHHASFNDVSLSEILDQTFQAYDTGKLETNFAPVSGDTIHYSVQHNQSAFSYASRLAAYHNEWFYYDGQKLIFGSPGEEETELSYGVDLKNFSVELSTVPNSFAYFTNDYLVDEVHQKSSDDVVLPSEGYHGFASNKSQELFNKQTQVFNGLYDDPTTKSRLDTQVEQYTKARAMKQVIAKGSSDNTGVRLGQIIKIKGYGSYRITKVIHTNTEGGVYRNDFEAIDASGTTYPKMDINRYPKSEIQIAIVMENNDPEGLSRIKVQFPWQKEMGEMTPWLRVMTPHAGGGKGFHFVPELGEEVVVNFEGGNAERPFVAGALYHGEAKADAWQTEENDIKAIRSRSGHTLELNDTDGEETIKIYDNDGSIIIFDTKTKSLTINATENIEIGAKNIKIVAEENIELQAQGDLKTASEGDTVIQSQGTANIQSQSDATLKSNAAVAVEATSDATVKGANAVVSGQATAEISGPQTKIAGSVMTEVSGAIVKIN